jgi:basic membrane protein A
VSIQPPKNASPEVVAKVEKAVADIKSGAVTVEKNLTPIK